MDENQRTTVLELLRLRPICGVEFLHLLIPRYAARIHELRQEGYRIDTEACTDPNHWHKSRQIRYILVPDIAAGQLTIEDAQ